MPIGSGGTMLPQQVRAKMERALGADFSTVRVHEGPEAQAVGAVAFTRGEDIYFAPGRYDPSSTAGEELLGHELSHVVQQRQGRVAQPGPDDAAIEGDASLEAEADLGGSRAARGEAAPATTVPVAAPSGGGGASATAPIQRFRDPTTDEEVDIAALERDDVEKYLDLIQKGTLKVKASEFRDLARRRKGYLEDREKIGAANAEAMNEANAGGGPKYLHNVPQQKLQQLRGGGVDPTQGYADPTRFDQLGKFTWRVKQGISASAALTAFLEPTDVTIAECQTVLQAVFYKTVRSAVGVDRFDAKLGLAAGNTPVDDRLRLDMDLSNRNPLGKLTESLLDGAPVSTQSNNPHALVDGKNDHLGLDSEERGNLTKTEQGAPVSAPDHRPVKVGGWYYMKNHGFYTDRHKGGLWGGENALYVGRNQEGHQIYSGFGLPNATEQQMAAHMATETNRAPSAARAAELFAQGKLGLALPVLGDIDSVDQMVLTEPMIAVVDKAWRAREGHAGDVVSATAEIAKQRLKTVLGELGELPQPVTADDILVQSPLGEVAQGRGEAQNDENRQMQLKQLTIEWEETEDGAGTACVRGKVKTTKPIGVRVSASDLVKFYADQYRLDYHADMYVAFRQLNDEAPPNIDLVKDVVQTFHFPRPAMFIKRMGTSAGMQMLGGKNLSPDKIRAVFGADALFEE